MKASVVILILAFFTLGSLSMTSCLVNRKSEGYACNIESDCGLDSGRTCENGYCVPVGCPSQCESCDLTDKTCRIECASNKACATVQCPAGYDCTIKCSNANACGDIDCSQSNGCNITCSGGSSCRNINCGAQACAINCGGVSSCGTIDCAASCRCDVNCNNQNACPSVSCPQSLGLYCSTDEMANSPCDSTAGPTCDQGCF